MSAIIPHLEVQTDVTPLERAYDLCVGTMNGAFLGENNPACPSPNAVLADAHAGLLGMVFVRDAVFESLKTKQFIVQPGNKDGKDARNVYLVLDQPIGPGPAWNPATDPNVQQYQLLSWTSKMNTPSWSLPAGAPQIGGACPGATAGQSIVPAGALIAGARLVNRGLGRPADAPVNLAASICEHCYATGGQYSTGQVQFAQLLRFLWSRQAIHFAVPAPDGSPSTAFVETMIYAINNADYKLDGGTVQGEGEEVTQQLPPEPTGRRFFRIHDSGDFFEEEYFRQWKMIADRLPDITFWAPTRIWATSWGIDAVNRINHRQDNFIIRPSAYEVNEAGPNHLGPGWAGATTVIAVGQNLGMSPDREQQVSAIENKSSALRAAIAAEHSPQKLVKLRLALDKSMPRAGTDPRYTWDCRAYATDDAKHTCRKAVAPPGLGGPNGKGCRSCWIAPNEIVNYSLH